MKAPQGQRQGGPQEWASWQAEDPPAGGYVFGPTRRADIEGAHDTGRLKQENWEMRKMMVMAEEAARKAEIEKDLLGYEKLDV